MPCTLHKTPLPAHRDLRLSLRRLPSAIQRFSKVNNWRLGLAHRTLQLAIFIYIILIEVRCGVRCEGIVSLVFFRTDKSRPAAALRARSSRLPQMIANEGYMRKTAVDATVRLQLKSLDERIMLGAMGPVDCAFPSRTPSSPPLPRPAGPARPRHTPRT